MAPGDPSLPLFLQWAVDSLLLLVPLSVSPPSALQLLQLFRAIQLGGGYHQLSGVPQRPPYLAPQVFLFAWIQGFFPRVEGLTLGWAAAIPHSIPPGIPRAQRESHFLLPRCPGLGLILLHVDQLTSVPGPVSVRKFKQNILIVRPCSWRGSVFPRERQAWSPGLVISLGCFLPVDEGFPPSRQVSGFSAVSWAIGSQ